MIEQYIKKLENIATWQDPEAAHEGADEILCEALEYLGQSDLVKAYSDVQPKWYA